VEPAFDGMRIEFDGTPCLERSIPAQEHIKNIP
jgi:hypothetical protein